MQGNKNKLLLMLMLCCAIFVLGGCAGDSIQAEDFEEDFNTDMWMAEYASFSGVTEKEFTVPMVKDAMININIRTESGSLNLDIVNDKGSYYQGKSLPTSSFQVAVPEGEKITVRFEGSGHVGSFSIDFKAPVY